MFEGSTGDALRARSGGTECEVEVKDKVMTVHSWANIWARKAHLFALCIYPYSATHNESTVSDTLTLTHKGEISTAKRSISHLFGIAYRLFIVNKFTLYTQLT